MASDADRKEAARATKRRIDALRTVRADALRTVPKMKEALGFNIATIATMLGVDVLDQTDDPDLQRGIALGRMSALDTIGDAVREHFEKAAGLDDLDDEGADG